MMKNNFKRIVLCVLLVVSAFYVSIGNVYARTITIEEFYNKLNEHYKDIDKARVTLDKENNKIKIQAKENTVDLNYTDDYIEFDALDRELTEENFAELSLGNALLFVLICNDLFELAGYNLEEYESNSNESEEDWMSQYDQYGLEVRTEYFEKVNENSSVKGDCIKYFKISLDTNKIDKLIEKMLQKKEDKNDLNTSKYTADVTVTSSDSSYNTIQTKVYNKNTNETLEDAKCYIYRSNSKDGDYQKLFSTPINCSAEYIDSDIEKNVSYFYKVSVESLSLVTNPVGFDVSGTSNGSDKYSSSNNVSDKTEDNKEDKTDSNDKKSSTVENPKTGISLHTLGFIMTLLATTVGYGLLRKRRILKKL